MLGWAVFGEEKRASPIVRALDCLCESGVLFILDCLWSLRVSGATPKMAWILATGQPYVSRSKGRPCGLAHDALDQAFWGVAEMIAAGPTDDNTRPILEFLRVVVQTQNGCEAVVRTKRQCTCTYADGVEHVLVPLDLQNAFSCLCTVQTHSRRSRHFT